MTDTAETNTPDHEVKLLLRVGDALDGAGSLAPALAHEFAMPDRPAAMVMQFVDTPSKELNASGWNVRLRRTDGQDQGELTYKKRYAVETDQMDQAWGRARGDGLTADGDYRKQVEWNLTRKTVSFSLIKSFHAGAALPGHDESVVLAVDELPGRLRRQDIGGKSVAELLKSGATVYGPVHGVRWTGTWAKRRVRIERWDIRGPHGEPGAPVVELSLVEADYFAAMDSREALRVQLHERGWLDPSDSLKTQLILERYGT